MASSVNESNLEKKFLSVTNTQDSIQTLSLWILHHRAHHKKIVDIWMKVLKKAKINHRLTLFYLVNDVVQNGKRKGYPQFGEAFSEVLKEATLLVRSEKIRPSVERVFNIWGQRNIYGSAFISELQGLLLNSKVTKAAAAAAAAAAPPRKLLAEFKHENVISKIKQVVSLEAETATKITALNVSKLDATKPELLQQLKDRSLGQRFSCDYDDATTSLEDVIESLEKEVKQRAQLISLLEQSEIYYDSQRGEAKIVANAYRNFGAKIKSLQRKLEEVKAKFPSPSPVPSPCAEDAPSLANSDPEADTDLPNTKGGHDDLDFLGNAPSPEGSPEGLGLTPPHSEKVEQENNIGNPIPTLSNFFPQASGVMSSWLDAFSSSSKNSTPVISSPTPDTKKADPSSLDSRLSNLMQNIPSLSSGLQSSLFGGSSSGGLTPNRDVDSPSPYKDTAPSGSNVREVRTPVKDECSGQNTPLQDEDIHSSNHSGFFNPSTSSSKTSQSSKDVLKGLTNLIQTVTSATAEKPDYDPKQNISDFIKKIAPSLTHLSPHSSSPITFLNSPQNTFMSQPNENVHSSPPPAAITSPNPSQSYSNSSYSPSRMDPYSQNTSSPTKAVHENLSFIPTLVPSTPHDGGFDFTGDGFPADEYNPESENYLPIDNEDDLCPVDTPSPTLLDESCESPDDLSDEDDIPKNLNNQRQSTLITLVAEEKTPTPTPTAEPGSPSSEGSMSHSEGAEFLSPPHNLLQSTNVVQNPVSETWPPVVNMQIGNGGGLVLPQDLVVPEPTLPPPEPFIGDHDERQPLFSPVMPPPPIPEQVPLNGGCETFAPPSSIETTLVSYPLSKIETVQSHRNDGDRWFGNDWGGGFHGPRHNQFHGNEQRPNFNRRPFEQRDFQFRRGGPHSNFRPRNNNWQPRERRFNEFEQGSPHPKRFTPFPGRGRGWRNNYQQQQQQ